MNNKNSNIKVLFYTFTARAFRTTLVGHLYEICRAWPTVLISEKLDQDSEDALKNKDFPHKLGKIIQIRQFSGVEKNNIFAQNKYLYSLAKKFIEEEKPDIVVTASDMHSLFEMYLLRLAKKNNSLNLCLQPSNTGGIKVVEKWVDHINAYLRFPIFLPLWLRIFLVKCRKYSGHLFYYWILPVTAGQMPFFGKSSHILVRGNSGMRDSDYQIVFSHRDYNFFIKDGVPAEKLRILSHPLARKKTREFFEKIYFKNYKKNKGKKTVVLMIPTGIEIGFFKKDFSLIPQKGREEKWVETIRLISRILPGWDIFIKPHPDTNTKNFDDIKNMIESISENIKIADPGEPADKYIELADIIIGLPPSTSTTIFTASLQCPEKPIISLDFYQEVLGDFYKEFEGIEYIDNEKRFIEILKDIRDKKYQKKQRLKKEEFSNIVELINNLISAKNEKRN